MVGSFSDMATLFYPICASMLSERPESGFLLVIICLILAAFAAYAAKDEATGHTRKLATPDIKDVIVCNVYWEEFKKVKLSSPRTSKFVVTFVSPVEVDALESVTVSGPNGYTFDFELQPHCEANLNGYLEAGGHVWFLGFERSGFLEDGSYTFTVRFRNGHVARKVRSLDYSSEILDAYLRAKPEFSPSGQVESGTDLSNVVLKWTVLPDVDAYYLTRIGIDDGRNDNTLTGVNWVYADTILGFGTGNLFNTGLNKDQLPIDATLRPAQEYVWFTEILDANDFQKMNLAIFCTYQKVAFSDDHSAQGEA